MTDETAICFDVGGMRLLIGQRFQPFQPVVEMRTLEKATEIVLHRQVKSSAGKVGRRHGT